MRVKVGSGGRRHPLSPEVLGPLQVEKVDVGRCRVERRARLLPEIEVLRRIVVRRKWIVAQVTLATAGRGQTGQAGSGRARAEVEVVRGMGRGGPVPGGGSVVVVSSSGVVSLAGGGTEGHIVEQGGRLVDGDVVGRRRGVVVLVGVVRREECITCRVGMREEG